MSASRERPQPWGKWSGRESPLPLRSHLLDSAACAGALWDLWLRPGLRTQVAERIADGQEGAARARVMLVAGLHDLGKATPIFQGQVFAKRRGPEIIEHLRQMEIAGFDTFAPPFGLVPGNGAAHIASRHECASFARTLEGRAWALAGDFIGLDWAAACAGGHHGVFHVGAHLDDYAEVLERTFAQVTSGTWGEAQEELIQELCVETGAELEDLRTDLGADTMTVALLLTGFTMVSDWLASAHPGDPEESFEERLGRYAALLPSTLGVPAELHDPRSAVLGTFATTPRPLQLALEGIVDDLVLVGETTGSGKTEAALLRHAALGAVGLMFALPTRATSNAMWGRVRHAFRDVPVAASLLHEYRDLDAFYAAPPRGVEAGPYRTTWLESTRHALLAPLAVGTVDQVLVGALRRKHVAVRLLALANRHVVLDEVHTYDPYQRELLVRLLRWWGRTRTPITMLSATLPQAAQRRFAEAYLSGASPSAPSIERRHAAVYPGIVSCDAGGVDPVRAVPLETARRYRLGVRIQSTPTASIVAPVLAACAERRVTEPDACIGIIVNRVDTAIQIGQRLLSAGEPVLVLHSRMTAGHRERVAREIERRLGAGGARGALTVVGTQVLEASLDIDFDHLISELAPAASLVQRAGRLWRHSTPGADGVWTHPPAARRSGMRPVLDLITRSSRDDMERAALPYLVWELSRTNEWLRGRSEISVPEEVQDFVDAAHFHLSELEGSGELGAAIRAAEHEVSRVRSADRMAVPFQLGAMLDEEVLQTHGALAMLTEIAGPADDDAEANGTRYEEIPMATVMLCDPDASGSAFWRGDPLLAATATEDRIRREVVERSLPVRESMIGKRLVDLTDEVLPEHRRHQRLRLVRLGTGARYDEVLGLCFDDEHQADGA